MNCKVLEDKYVSFRVLNKQVISPQNLNILSVLEV